MTENKNIVFSAAVRGFHIYKSIWQPIEGELMDCLHEEDNPHDVFSIKVFKKDFPNSEWNILASNLKEEYGIKAD